jgi:hypothetical protein
VVRVAGPEGAVVHLPRPDARLRRRLLPLGGPRPGRGPGGHLEAADGALEVCAEVRLLHLAEVQLWLVVGGVEGNE